MYGKTFAAAAALFALAPAAAQIAGQVAGQAAPQFGAQVATFTVSTPAQLTALLPTLTQPSLVLLAPGHYGEIFLRNINPAGEIVVRSADPADPAVIRTLQVRTSSGLRFDGLVFNRPRAEGESDTVNSLMIRESSRIAITGSRFFSNLNGDPMDDGYLMRIMDSDDVVVLDNDFRDGRIAILTEWSRGILIASNHFQDLREGLNFAGGERLRAERNYFTRIYPNVDLGDHTDCIQLYQMRDGSAANQVQFTNNVMIPVSHQAQGIFIRNSLDSTRPHRDVRVLNNLYFGGMRAGISVANVDGGFVARNTVLAAPTVAFEPGLLLRHTTNMRLERSMQPVLMLENSQPQQAGVVMLHWAKNPSGVPAQDQVTGSLNQALPAIAAFAVAPGSAAAAVNAGFQPVSEIGDVPDAERDSRYLWYRLNAARLTSVANPALEEDQPAGAPTAEGGAQGRTSITSAIDMER